MFENQPKGLYALALANTGERFGYYTMLAVFALFLRANYGLDAGWAGETRFNIKAKVTRCQQ
jgi:POT family proton-dependent oligopeptide transporter